MRRPVIFCSFSLSPGSQLNTRLCSTIQAARLRLGGSGLQTMSNIREQSFSASVTSNAGAGVKSKLHIRETLAHLHMNVAIFQDKLKAPQSIGRRERHGPDTMSFAISTVNFQMYRRNLGIRSRSPSWFRFDLYRILTI